MASGGYLSGGPVHRPGLVALARRSGGGPLPGGGGDLLQLALFITILCNRWGLRGWMGYIRNSGLCWSVTFRPFIIPNISIISIKWPPVIVFVDTDQKPISAKVVACYRFFGTGFGFLDATMPVHRRRRRR